MVPRRRVEYRGSTLEEMDLPAILARAPELALIDELAHTNAAGARAPEALRGHRRRARRRIDVFSTVNVQHLESLNDQVAELTGVRVRETFPTGARRGRRGGADRPHARGAARAPARRQGLPARSGSTPRSTTSSGSRTSRRCASSRCARWPRTSRRSSASARADETVGTRERVIEVARRRRSPSGSWRWSRPRPSSQRLVRRAWRSAQRLGAELDLLWVAAAGRAPIDEEREHSGASPAGLGARRARCWSRRATTSRRSPPRSRAERGTTYI